jgi:hypothetical protein
VTATINAADIATQGTATVTTFNPTPGGGTSNGVTFTIDAAPPLIRDTRLFCKRGTGASLLYWYPSTGTCDRVISTHADYSSPLISDTDAGSNTGYRIWDITGAATGTVYYWKITCPTGGTQTATGNFSTNNADGGTQSVGIYNAIAATNAKICYGPTTTLGTCTTNQSCGSGCNITAGIGSGLYYLQLFLDNTGIGPVNENALMCVK